MCVGRLTTVVKNEKQEQNTTQSEQLQNPIPKSMDDTAWII